MAQLWFLLGLALSLAAAQKFDLYAVVRSHYDMDKISGAWYPMAMASNNLSRIQHQGDMHAIIKRIEHLENGSLTFSFYFLLQGQCETAVMVCKQTQRSGMCTIEYEGKSTVLILETDYKTYITFYLRNIKETTETRVLALYGRVHQLSQVFLDRFLKICQKYGLGPDSMINLETEDICSYHH